MWCLYTATVTLPPTAVLLLPSSDSGPTVCLRTRPSRSPCTSSAGNHWNTNQTLSLLSTPLVANDYYLLRPVEKSQFALLPQQVLPLHIQYNLYNYTSTNISNWQLTCKESEGFNEYTDIHKPIRPHISISHTNIFCTYFCSILTQDSSLRYLW